MENNQIYQNKNGWKLTAIILIAVSVILAGVAVYFGVQSAKDTESTSNRDIAKDDSYQNEANIKEKEEQEDLPDIAENNGEFLIVPEWGIKIRLPYLNQLSRTFANSTTFAVDTSIATPTSGILLSAEKSLVPSELCVALNFRIVRVAVTDKSKFTDKNTIGGIIVGNYGYIPWTTNDGGICSEAEMEIREEISSALGNPQNYVAL